MSDKKKENDTTWVDNDIVDTNREFKSLDKNKNKNK